MAEDTNFSSRHCLHCRVAPGAGLGVGADGADAHLDARAAGQACDGAAGFGHRHFLLPARRRHRVHADLDFVTIAQVVLVKPEVQRPVVIALASSTRFNIRSNLDAFAFG